MARKKSEPSEEDLKLKSKWGARLERGKRYQEANCKDWAKNEKLVFGINPYGENEDDAELAYGWGLFKSLETAIYVQDPDFFVESKFNADPDTAKRLTDITRTDVKDMDLKSSGGLMLLDTMICGYGLGVEIIKTDKKFVRFPAGSIGGLIEEDTDAEMPVEQSYEVVRVHPMDSLFDPRGTKLDLSDHGWVAHAFYPTIAELQGDESFRLPEKLDSIAEATQTTRPYGASGERPSVGRGSKSEESDPNFKTCCVWEVWDKPEQKIHYFLDSGYHYLGTKPWPCKLKIGPRSLFPATVMAMHPNPRGFYPKPVISLVRRQLEKLNKIEADMDGYYKNRWKKHLAPASWFTNDTITHLTDTTAEHSVILVEKDELDAFVGPSSTGQVDMQRLVVQMQDPMVPQDYYVRKQGIEQDIQQILGYGPSDRGGLPQTRSAREAVMINDSKQQKLVKLADQIADFYREFCSKHLLLLQSTMAVERAARKWPLPASGMAEWFKYGKEAILGDFAFNVYAGSSGPRTTETKKQMAQQELSMLAPIFQAEGKSIYPLLRKYGSVMGWDDIEEMLGNGKAEIKNLAAASAMFAQGQVGPEKLLEQIARAVQANLSNNDIAEVKNFLAQGISGSGGQPSTGGGMRGDPGKPSAATGAM